VPPRLAGQRAFAILSAPAVAEVAGSHGVAVARDAVADDLGAALRAADPGRRRGAMAAAAEVGLRLACVLATLRNPGTASAQGWNPWRRAYLRHWAAMGEVHLAGGLLAGDAGQAVVDQTRATLARLDTPTRTALMPWPARAALIGAARRLGAEAGDVLALDLGGSSVKTALVRVAPGGAAELTALTTTRVPVDPEENLPSEALAEFLAGILETAAGDARSLGARTRAVAISVACFLGRDRRCADRGIYANLPVLRDEAWRRRLGELVGRSVELGVFHDGTAAAASLPGDGGAPGAVLVLGTALGVGFPPAGLPAWRSLTVRPGP
jgi:hypothetical protein